MFDISLSFFLISITIQKSQSPPSQAIGLQEAHAQVDQDVWQVHNGIRPGRQEAGPAVLTETCGRDK